MAGEWLRYANQGATRNQPISPQLAKALGSFLPQMGVTMEVFSGGQPGKGSGGARVGSVRHDHGGAADVFFHKEGRRLDWTNAQDLPLFQDIVRQGKAAGITGFGAGQGYMQPGSMHIGFGAPGVWGAGGKGSSAPNWLTEAYGGAPAAPNKMADMFAQSAPVPAGAAGGLADTMVAQQAGVANAALGLLPGGGDGAGAPSNMLLGDIASMFVQNQQKRQEQRKAEQAADQMRRQALFGGGVASLFG